MTSDTIDKGGSIRGWKLIGLITLAGALLVIGFRVIQDTGRAGTRKAVAETPLTFVGREACIDCHAETYEKWAGSHHDMAMTHAGEDTVRGDFDDAVFEYGGVTSRFYRRDGRYFVHTEGPGGETGEFEILYTFGVEPLQQYLIPLPGGRLQALSTAWDTDRQRWFFLYPEQEISADDWLHWTRGGQNWNGMCAECHSTNLVKAYDPQAKTYDTSWSEIDVSCEACHGPGSRHFAWADTPAGSRPDMDHYGLAVRTSGIDNRRQVALCAPCHARRSELGDYDHTGKELLDTFAPSLLREGVYHPDGQILEEDYVWGSFVQSKMYRNGVFCSDCHDVHSLELRAQGNELCTRCHEPATYDVNEHHFHQEVPKGEPGEGPLCVKCHMPEQPYMVIDYRADHSIRVPRPDLTVALGVPNACNNCHDDRPADWAVQAINEWYGETRKPHFGIILAAARKGDPAARDALIELVEDPIRPAIVRATALELLQAYPGEETDRVMREALAAEEALVRHTAVDTLVAADQATLAALLAPLLSDPVRTVRLRAATRLAGVPASEFTGRQRKALLAALADYTATMEQGLDFTHGGMNLGNLALAQGDPAKAEDYFRTAIEIDDLFFPAKMNLAVLLSQQGRDGEAEVLLREVLEAYPEQHEAAYSLALLLAGTGRAGQAEPLLRQASEGMPRHSRAHYNYGLLLQQLGKDAEAEQGLMRALALEPENFDYLYALFDYYAKRNRVAEALAMTEAMIAAHPDNPTGHELKALVEEFMRK